MHKSNDTYNFKGTMVGNGYTAPYTNQMAYDVHQQLTVISYDLWKKIRKAGCIWIFNIEDIERPYNPPECDGYLSIIYETFLHINIYDVYRHNWNPLPTQSKPRNGTAMVNGTLREYNYTTRGQRDGMLASLLGKDHPFVKSIVGDAYDDYFNREDVRAALHIPTSIPHYVGCNNYIGSTFKSQREGSVWIYPILKAYGYKILYFEGVTDASIVYTATYKWMEDFGYNMKLDWVPYIYNDEG